MTSILRRIRGNFHFRLIAMAGLATLLIVLSEMIYDTIDAAHYVKDEYRREARVLTEVVARGLEQQVSFLQPATVEKVLQPISQMPDISKVELLDRVDNILLDGNPKTPPHKSSDFNTVHHQAIRSRQTIETEANEKLTIIEPLLVSEQAVGSIMVEFKIPNFWATMIKVLLHKLTTSIPIVLLGGLLMWSVISRMINPLRNLVEAAKSIEKGNLDIKIDAGEFEDIRKVGDALESMASSLRGRFEEIYELAYLDRITHLPNREYFLQELKRTLKVAVRKNQTGALLFLDLDGFKAVNDRLGHEYGDRLLEEFARRVVSVLRADSGILVETKPEVHQLIEEQGGATSDEQSARARNFFARLGGDEFTIIVPDLSTETNAARVAKRIIDAVAQPFNINGKFVSIGASIGIATFPHDSAESEVVLKNADFAMYEAKNAGKNTFRFHSDVLNEEASRKVRVEAELRRAISQDELDLFYQPRVSARDHTTLGVEAVLRWSHPEWGTLNEREFMQIVNDGGLAYKLDEWLLNRAIEDLRRFYGMGLSIKISVNVAGPQFGERGFGTALLAKMQSKCVDPELLELQIPEKLATLKNEQGVATVLRLKEAGVGLVVEGYGAGCSSIVRLVDYSYDAVNIDSDLVKGINEDEKGRREIIAAIVTMAKLLGLGVNAKGVDNQQQVDYLKELGCDGMQGSFICEALTFDELCEWLNSHEYKGARKLQQTLKTRVS